MSDTIFHTAMRVERRHGLTEYGTSSWIEPPLNGSWEDLDKLKWQAGVLYVDTGIKATITVHQDFYGPKFGLQFYPLDGSGSHSLAAMDFGYAWAYLSHVSLGAELVQGRKS